MVVVPKEATEGVGATVVVVVVVVGTVVVEVVSGLVGRINQGAL